MDNLVHVSAAADYSTAQRAAWAPEDLDVQEWGRRRAAAETRVAVHDGSIAGFADLAPQGHIGMFYVDPEHGRRGVGAALLAVLLREATARGVRQLTVDASLTARGFFECAGFTSVREQRVHRGGQEFTNVLMRLVLREAGDRQDRCSAADGRGGDDGADAGGADTGGQDDRALLQRAAARRRAGWALLEQLRLPGVEGFDLADERGERAAVLRVEEQWHRRADYPGGVGGVPRRAGGRRSTSAAGRAVAGHPRMNNTPAPRHPNQR
nr:GNAT family N-acetyltransferase [Kineococcus vitellinus]